MVPFAEDWILVRNPISEKSIAANVLRHGTGGLNIDAGRVSGEPVSPVFGGRKGTGDGNCYGDSERYISNVSALGRFPANLTLDEDAAALLDAQSGELHTGAMAGRYDGMGYHGSDGGREEHHAANSGGASRFFYCAKTSPSERGADNRHPTVKPFELMSYFAKLITPPKGMILDPFFGSGATGLAAASNGFRYTGIELNPEYVELARDRINGPLFSSLS